ncbi:hypothetical protein OEZ85_002521 [Tetradesmus obliquus]|uniref:Alginate lyase domain-containing protein n=1 Tax=Tetradesmus obliquus TaxID=3088 RepID=A0ABY8U1X0_TETOB|nr:hypothetical protein OEZ85_002521 [Tetradesmus obliquus]
MPRIDAADQEYLVQMLRPDLNPNGSLVADEPNYYMGHCTQKLRVPVPVITPNGSMHVTYQRAPRRLTKDVIFKTKAYVMSSLRTTNLKFTDFDPVKATYKALRSFNDSSGFVHPGGVIGPAELALMQHRLQDNATLQELALKTLLTGAGVIPKTYNNGWQVPTDTPINYAGPFVLVNVSARYGGSNKDSGECPQNYPDGAPRDNCAHISLVELDAQQTYKQALAFWATGNVTYAENALRITHAWASNNQAFGDVRENGPLEAAWAVASFAKALELLRGRVPGWQATYEEFMAWTEQLLMPQTDEYMNSTKKAIAIGQQNVLNNWHSTIAEAWMAVGVLTDDKVRYRKAVNLYHATVRDYTKWGRAKGFRDGGRVLGETSETLRDIYHTQFGLGGLLQVAEMAWQQDMDLYSSNQFALVPALELTARIIMANDSESQLPQGFKLLKSMPKPPSGTMWAFDMQRQRFFAKNKTSGAWVADLNDGIKYLQGITFLPTAWEHAYNHYVGRLGLKMPETAALIKRHYVDWYAMHWGGGTLSHANTAGSLWRAGLRPFTVCSHEQHHRHANGSSSSSSGSSSAQVFSTTAERAISA